MLILFKLNHTPYKNILIFNQTGRNWWYGPFCCIRLNKEKEKSRQSIFFLVFVFSLDFPENSQTFDGPAGDDDRRQIRAHDRWFSFIFFSRRHREQQQAYSTSKACSFSWPQFQPSWEWRSRLILDSTPYSSFHH